MRTPGLEHLVGERFRLADARELEAVFHLLDVAQELCGLGLIEEGDDWCQESERILERVEEREPS
jgi:hypothetical protein